MGTQPVSRVPDATPVVARYGVDVRRLGVLVVIAVAAAALARRLSASRPHGSPDVWPEVPRRP